MSGPEKGQHQRQCRAAMQSLQIQMKVPITIICRVKVLGFGVAYYSCDYPGPETLARVADTSSTSGGLYFLSPKP